MARFWFDQGPFRGRRGPFSFYCPRLRCIARNLWVIEKHPRERDLAEIEAEKFIPTARL
jgi:hypothetical protein